MAKTSFVTTLIFSKRSKFLNRLFINSTNVIIKFLENLAVKWQPSDGNTDNNYQQLVTLFFNYLQNHWIFFTILSTSSVCCRGTEDLFFLLPNSSYTICLIFSLFIYEQCQQILPEHSSSSNFVVVCVNFSLF